MNIENLNTQELDALRTLLNKMADAPQPKIYFDPINEMIDNIMDEFDFAKVHMTMDYLGWKWVGQDVTIAMLRDEARRLLKGAAQSRLGNFINLYWELGITNGTGGFQATAYCDETKTKITGLDLKFVLTEWDSELEDLNK
jgi:hypothetical protein